MKIEKDISRGEIIFYIITSLIITMIFWDKYSFVSFTDFVFGNYNFIPDWSYLIFTPFKLYTTAIHEGWHAFMSLVTGGEIGEISLKLDGSGHVISGSGIGILVIPAGYIGCALTGAAIILSTKKEWITDIVLISIAIMIMYMNIMHIDSYFSIAFLSSLMMSVLLIYVAIKSDQTRIFSAFLGTILAVDSFQDIKKIIFHMPYETDAGILARSFNAEFLAIPFAIVFSVICMYIWWKSIKYIMKNT